MKLRQRQRALGLAIALAAGTAPMAASASGGDLLALYEGIHAAPELSHHEARTSGVLAAELRAAGYTVADRVGVYPDGSRAYGVVGVLKNGAGPTLMIRADMDALPIREETALPYAIHVVAPGPD